MNFVDLELLGGGLYWAFVKGISYTEYSVILCVLYWFDFEVLKLPCVKIQDS